MRKARVMRACGKGCPQVAWRAVLVQASHRVNELHSLSRRCEGRGEGLDRDVDRAEFGEGNRKLVRRFEGAAVGRHDEVAIVKS